MTASAELRRFAGDGEIGRDLQRPFPRCRL
jgi:hypothetical protein